MIGVKYHNRYAVEEFFQFLKVPWEWYVPGHIYDVVIARKSEVPELFNILMTPYAIVKAMRAGLRYPNGRPMVKGAKA